jgi:glycosyltransferase involved in cell wall biosynthesis
MDSGRLTIVHAIHDFLPRHRAGSEIYAFNLCRHLADRHDITILCAEYDLGRHHGEVVWRMYEGLPVVEVVNNWTEPSFEDTYRSPLITNRLDHVLRAIRPDVLHVHSLLNLSFELPRLASARGIPVVGTLHDYTLVCASGGQRIHRAESYLCEVIDPVRCARCFEESTLTVMRSAAQASTALPSLASRAAAAAYRLAPGPVRSAVRFVRAAGQTGVAPSDIAGRLNAARAVLGEFDCLVAPSRSIADEFVWLGADPGRLEVSDYGTAPLRPAGVVRHDEMQPDLVRHQVVRHGAEQPAGEGDRKVRFGYAGTLVWHKGVHVAIDALRSLPPGRAELQVWGDPETFPEYVADLRRRAEGLPVRFMGGFERPDAANVYAGIDVLIVPSLWLENSPLVIHEAFISGVPVIGSRIGGIPGLVNDGVNGLLVDAGSDASLAAAMRALIDSPSRIRQLASGAPRVKSIGDDAAFWTALYADVGARAGHTRGPRAMETVS